MKSAFRSTRAVLAAGLIFLGASAATVGMAGTAAAAVPANATFKTNAPTGTGNQNLLFAAWTDPKTGLVVTQDMWDCPCGPETLWADGSGDWGVASNQKAGNKRVLTYPNVRKYYTTDGQYNGTPTPEKEYRAINASFHQSQPSAGDFESAFDIWLNNYKTEIMVWTDNRGQFPAGSPVGTASIWNHTWTLFHDAGGAGDGTPPGGTYSFVIHGNEAKGVVHVVGMLDWLIKHKDIPASSTIDDVEYGWEICSTNGKAEQFTMLGYNIKTAKF